MYVEIVSGGQPFTAGRVCLKKKMSFAPWVIGSYFSRADMLYETGRTH